MSSENFLARWSRRKHEAADDSARPVADEPARVTPDTESKAPEGMAAKTPDELLREETAQFDPESLPPLESIGPESDISAFLAKNVPVALKHAALRRVWASDPAIRDFVGLQENDWDFTNPDSIPGFGGAIAEHDVRDMVRRVFGEFEHAAAEDAGNLPVHASVEPGPDAESVRLRVERQPENCEANDVRCQPEQSSADDEQAPTQIVQCNNNAATQSNGQDRVHSSQRSRQHGGALPKGFPEGKRNA
jgi:hypothetical protein